MVSYYAENGDKIRASVSKWRKDNPERNKANVDRWRADNPEKKKALDKDWRDRNVAKQNSYSAFRRATKIQATPPWIGPEEAINEAYETARERSKSTGIPWNVDHIIPLKGKIVCGLHCGLHVLENLRVIPEKTNHQKGNRYAP